MSKFVGDLRCNFGPEVHNLLLARQWALETEGYSHPERIRT